VCEFKIFFELGKNATKTFETLKAALGQLKIGNKLFSKFESGMTTLEDDESSPGQWRSKHMKMWIV
jgi:hypothetical protein